MLLTMGLTDQASIFFSAHASRRRVRRKHTRLDRRAAEARASGARHGMVVP